MHSYLTVALLVAALAVTVGTGGRFSCFGGLLRLWQPWSAWWAPCRLSVVDGAMPVIVVVGAGLAGHCAALSAAEACPDCSVVLLDKEARVGGNSAKASSGISGVTPEHGDTVQQYREDTMRSGGGLSSADLVDALAGDSESALEWLRAGGVDLHGTVQLGGHSRRRTHFPPKGNVGYSLVQSLERRVGQQPNVRVETGVKVTELLPGNGGGVVGVRREPTAGGTRPGAAAAQRDLPAGVVVLATGGFGASRELLRRHAPHAAALATTNGAFAQGEGLALARGAGAAMVDLDQVQIHPTGFVDPTDPGSAFKFLAPEKLRGAGGILLDAGGRRFVDELGTRDVVSEALLKLPHRQAHLLLGAASAQLLGPMLEFYAAKGLASRVDGYEAAAAMMGVPPAVLAGELQRYNQAAAAGDAVGKSVFPARIDPHGEMYVALVTPVVHYTMGGARIDGEGRVLDAAGHPVPGLFAAGEVAGGLHGRNRLGGNSLAE